MAYTFNITPYGTVEVFNDGQRIATTTEDNAKLNYGYGGTPGQSPIAPSITPSPVNTNPTPPAQTDSTYQVRKGETIDAYNSRIAAYNASKSQTPATTPIPNPISPPTSTATGAPALPKATAPSTVDQFATGLGAQVDATRSSLEAEAKRRADEYQTKIDALNTENAQITADKGDALAQYGEASAAVTQQKQEALALEKSRFDENYNANQSLIGELDGLLSTGNKIIENMRNTTGLASIMNPRISQTMTDITARAGVIQTLLAARNGQIGQAQNQLASTVSTLESINADHLRYYEAVRDFYDKQTNDNNSKIASLSSEQKQYLDVKINDLNADMENVRKSADIIRSAMVDPDKATTMARAGVSLTDSPAQIADKIARYQYSREVSNISSTMAEKGYSTTPIPGITPVNITDTNGVVHSYYKRPSSTDGSFTLGANQIRFDAQGNVIASGPRTSSGTPVSSGLKLTPAKLASGAAKAGVTVDEFKQLDPLVQNFYANGGATLTASLKEIEKVSNGQESPDSVKSMIDQSNQPDAVKEYLKQEVDSAAPADSGGFWGYIGNIFKGALSAVSS
ncbi:hypothetical protein [Bradyrhizobium elkanii]|uniref:hypothetical protein n=1 Tax=Bradyrhizobium elkanii TaxID=29448 RepID=UPI003D247615